MSDDPGYILRVSDRTAAAMQLAAHFTAEAMRSSTAQDPRARLAEQLSYFDLSFRSIMGTTARGMIKAGATSSPDGEQAGRSGTRLFAGESR